MWEDSLSVFTDEFFRAFFSPLVPDTAVVCCTSFSHVDPFLIHDASAAFSEIISVVVP